MNEYDRFGPQDPSTLDAGLRLMETIIGGRWNPLILLALEAGAERFTDLKVYIPDISDTELQRKLLMLQNGGLVTKEPENQDARRRTYRLTPWGFEILHILHHILRIAGKRFPVEEGAEG